MVSRRARQRWPRRSAAALLDLPPVREQRREQRSRCAQLACRAAVDGMGGQDAAAAVPCTPGSKPQWQSQRRRSRRPHGARSVGRVGLGARWRARSRCRSPGPNSSNCSAGGSGKVPRVRARGRERRCIASAAHTWSPSHYRAHGGGNRRARHADLLGHPCSARCIGRSVHISRQGIFRDKPVTHVIYSNEHLDDIGGASLFPKGAATIAHRDTAALLAKRADPRRPLPTVTFDEHYALTVGGQTLELDYRGNNHEPGNIFIYAPRQKIVMLVDVVHPGHMPYKNLGITEDVQGTSKPIGNCCATTSTCSLRATSRGLERARTSRRRWPSSTTCAPPPDPCWPRHRSRTRFPDGPVPCRRPRAEQVGAAQRVREAAWRPMLRSPARALERRPGGYLCIPAR